MLLFALALSIVGTQPDTAALLEEQYALEAENCTTLACIHEGLAHLDNKMLLLLGRRAALVRHAQQLGLACRTGDAGSGQPQTDAQVHLRAQARAFGVPEALALHVFAALRQAAPMPPAACAPAAARR